MSAESRLVDLLVVFEEQRERGATLTPEELCRDDPDLLPEVRRALQAVARVPRPSTVCEAADGATLQTGNTALPHEAIRAAAEAGRYTVIRPHAKGGLGEVLIAQDQELKREVAVKRIQPRLATNADARYRFLREAEITARLEHPGIVPIYGLITDDTGQPCYAMRFVQGESLAEAVRQFHQTNQRWDSLAFRHLLQRFISVCQTVAYAHSRGVIHRDLKPANVMLGPYGETLVVDWGLAKQVGLDARASEESMAQPLPIEGGTLLGSTIGTPAYMPPEQAAGRWDEVGPASDIFSLGASFFELLTGQRPIQGETLHEVLMKAHRGECLRPRDVRPDVPRALEAICCRAMARQPADRYSSATALAEDVDHWLADEPVSVYTEPRSARLARWARKHPGRVGITATGLVVAALALAAGLGVVTHFNSKLDLANADLSQSNQRLDKANGDLKKTNSVFQTVSDILAKVVRDIDPRQGKLEGESLKVQLGERLEAAAAALESETGADPTAVAKLQVRLAVSLTHLGHFPRAVELLTRSRQTLAATLGTRDVTTMEAALHLGNALRSVGRTDESIPMTEEAHRFFEQTFGPETPEAAYSMNALGWTYHLKGWNDRALPLLEKSYRVLKEKEGPNDRDTLIAMNNLVVVSMMLGRRAEAVPLAEDLLKRMRALHGPEHVDSVAVSNTLANAYLLDGRPGDAIKLADDCFRSLKAKLGPDHPNTLVSLNNLAFLHSRLGNYHSALPLYTEAVRLSEAKLGADHLNTLMVKVNLGSTYQQMGRPHDAVPLLESTLKTLRATAGSRHLATLSCLGELGNAYQLAGRNKDAVTTLEESLALRKSALGSQHDDTLIAMNDLGLVYTFGGRAAEAVKINEETLALRRQILGPNHRNTLVSEQNLAAARRAAGQLAETLKLGEENLRHRREHLGPDDLDTLISMRFLGNVDVAAGRQVEGIALLKTAATKIEKQLGPESPAVIGCKHDLGCALIVADRFQEALPYLEEVLPRRKALLGPDHIDTFVTEVGVAMAYFGTNRFAEAEPRFRNLLARARKMPSVNAVNLSSFIVSHARCLVAIKNYAEAEALAREGLGMRQKASPEVWSTFYAQSLLGDCLAGQKRFAEAEPLLLQGYQGMLERDVKIPLASKRRLDESLERLVQLYDAWGKQEQAEHWRKKLQQRVQSRTASSKVPTGIK